MARRVALPVAIASVLLGSTPAPSACATPPSTQAVAIDQAAAVTLAREFSWARTPRAWP